MIVDCGLFVYCFQDFISAQTYRPIIKAFMYYTNLHILILINHKATQHDVTSICFLLFLEKITL